ncbi:hypothetical protein AAFN60_14505 [Roseibacillus persicicus]
MRLSTLTHRQFQKAPYDRLGDEAQIPYHDSTLPQRSDSSFG